MQGYPQTVWPPPGALVPSGAEEGGGVVAGVIVLCRDVPAVLAGGGMIAHAVTDSRRQVPNKLYARDLPAETLFPGTIGYLDPATRGR